MKKLTQSDAYLLLVFVFMIIAIITKSFFNIYGYLSPDSEKYLALAQNLLNNHSLYMPTDGNKLEWFSIWPVGYSYLIFICAWIFNLPVFIASKLVNILLFGGILLYLRKLFGKEAYLYGLIFYFSSYLEIFSFTWSENLFIFALVTFVTYLHRITSVSQGKPSHFIGLFLSLILLFLSRYIGMFGLGVLMLFGTYYIWLKERKKGGLLLLVASLSGLCMFLYLYNNFLKGGFITGQQRTPALESIYDFSLILFYGFLSEFSFLTDTIEGKRSWFFLSIQLIGIIGIFYRYQTIKDTLSKQLKRVRLSFLLTFTAGTYLICIILMRWLFHFDALDYRLLGPGVLLLLFAILHHLLNLQKALKTDVKYFLVSMAILSYLINVPFRIWYLS